MPNPYPVEVAAEGGPVVTVGEVTFTDPANQPGTSGNLVTSVFGRVGVVVPVSGDYAVGQVTGAAPLASPTFTGTVTVPAAAAVTSAPRLNQLSSALTIVAGALPDTGAWVSGTAKVNPVTRQIVVCLEVVTDGTANAATCAVAISPDDTTYTTIATPGADVAVNTIGAITLLSSVTLPAGWFIKLTFSHCTVAASIYY